MMAASDGNAEENLCGLPIETEEGQQKAIEEVRSRLFGGKKNIGDENERVSTEEENSDGDGDEDQSQGVEVEKGGFQKNQNEKEVETAFLTLEAQDFNSGVQVPREAILLEEEAEKKRKKKKKKKKQSKKQREQSLSNQDADQKLDDSSERDHNFERYCQYDRFVLKFIRCMKYDLDRTIALITKYWNYRTSVLQESNPRIDIATVSEQVRSAGFVTVPGARDRQGRLVVLMRPALINHATMSADHLIKYIWAVFEKVTDDEESMKKGFILINHMEGVGMGHVNRNLMSRVAESLQKMLPIRIAAIVILHQPWIFNMVWKFLSVLLSPKLLSRVYIWGTSVDKLSELLSAENVLSIHGGPYPVDHNSFLQDYFGESLPEA